MPKIIELFPSRVWTGASRDIADSAPIPNGWMAVASLPTVSSSQYAIAVAPGVMEVRSGPPPGGTLRVPPSSEMQDWQVEASLHHLGAEIDIEADRRPDDLGYRDGVYHIRYKGQRMAAAQGSHEWLMHRVRASRGAEIGTGGLPTISFRIDHGVDPWLQHFWPLYLTRDIPASLGVVTRPIGSPADPYEPTVTTWEQLREHHIDGFECWAHTHTHLDPLKSGYSIDEEVVLPQQYLERNGIRCMGWQAGGIPYVKMPHHSTNFAVPNSYASHYSYLVWENYALFEGGDPRGNYRRLPTFGAPGMARVTLDGLTLNQATAAVDFCVDYRVSSQFMIHPRSIMEGGLVHTPTVHAELLDYVGTLREQGKLLLLTTSGQHCANQCHSERLNLIRYGDFVGIASPITGSTSKWVRGGPAGGVITIGADEDQLYVRIPPEASTAYITQGFFQIANMHLDGATVMAEVDIRAISGAATASIRLANQTDLGANQTVRTKTKTVEPADGWVTMRMLFTIPLESTNIAAQLSRASGAGTLDFRNVRIRPI